MLLEMHHLLPAKGNLIGVSVGIIEVMTAVLAEAEGHRAIDVAKDGSEERETIGAVDVHEWGVIDVVNDGSVQVQGQGQGQADVDVKTEGLEDVQRGGLLSLHPAHRSMVETMEDGSVETGWPTVSSPQQKL